MGNLTHIPGFDVASAYIAHARRFHDAATDVEGADMPEPFVVSPQDADVVLMIFRLCKSFPKGDTAVLFPSAFSVTRITAPMPTDRNILHTLLRDLIEVFGEDRKAFCIMTEDQHGERNIKRFLKDVEAVQVCGQGIVILVTSADDYPTLDPMVSTDLVLPPPDAAMLSAALEFRHPGQSISVTCTDAEIAPLTMIHLRAIFAAETVTEANARLVQIVERSRPKSGITLDDVHGQPAAVAALRQVACDLGDWRSGGLTWSQITRSFLLIGPPGTGKTMLAEGLAGTAGVTFVMTSYSACQRAGHQGDMLRELYKVFDQGIGSAPSILFIDEIDSFYRRDRSQNGYITGVVNGLLTLLDKVANTEGVVVIAATNDVERVDPAVVRAGRFDQHLKVGPPNRAGIGALLRAALPEVLSESQLTKLMDQLLGATGAEIAKLVRDARTFAISAQEVLSADHVSQAADLLHPPPSVDLIWRIAVHEAGHLLAAHLLGLPPAQSASIGAKGGNVLHPSTVYLTPATLHARVCTSLAGRAAEQLIMDDISCGAGVSYGSDLSMATTLSLRAEAALGFGKSLSWYAPETPLSLLPSEIQERVEARLQQAQTEVTDLLRDHRGTLEHIARELAEKREMDQPELTRLIAEAVRGAGFSGRNPDPGRRIKPTPNLLDD